MLNLRMLQLGVKMLLVTNVIVDQIFTGRSVQVKMSLGRSVEVPYEGFFLTGHCLKGRYVIEGVGQ
jgi:hypothetical protein